MLNKVVKLGLIEEKDIEENIPKYTVGMIDKIPMDIVERVQQLRADGLSFSSISQTLKSTVIIKPPVIKLILAQYGQAPITNTITTVIENDNNLGDYIHKKTGLEISQIQVLSDNKEFVRKNLSPNKIEQNTKHALSILDLARQALEDGLRDSDPKIRIASAQVLAKGWHVYTSDCYMNPIKEAVQDVQHMLDKQKLADAQPAEQTFTVQVLKLDSKEFEKNNKYHQQLELRKKKVS